MRPQQPLVASCLTFLSYSVTQEAEAADIHVVRLCLSCRSDALQKVTESWSY